MFGHHGGSAFAALPPANSPWGNNATGSDLARDAGLNDIGRGARGDAQTACLFDNDDVAHSSDIGDELGGDPGGDFGGGFGGGDSA